MADYQMADSSAKAISVSQGAEASEVSRGRPENDACRASRQIYQTSEQILQQNLSNSRLAKCSNLLLQIATTYSITPCVVDLLGATWVRPSTTTSHKIGRTPECPERD